MIDILFSTATALASAIRAKQVSAMEVLDAHHRGFEPLTGHIPPKDGAIAARLKSAGAIIPGKTNMPVLLGNIQTENPIFGRSNNPLLGAAGVMNGCWPLPRRCPR
jgi:Asp-tRNA(Asn)/Glu-tRNA(Gln) amidotransferase A subunit family amidase